MTDEQGAQYLAANFPDMFARAKASLVKFKLANSRGAFTSAQVKEIAEGFSAFLRVWELLRPNWIYTPTGLISTHRSAFAEEVDAWVKNELRADSTLRSGLGFIVAAIVVIAGIVIAVIAGYGIADALRDKQRFENQAKLIEGVAAGVIPADILRDELKAANADTGFDLFGDIGGLITTVGVVGALLLFGPQLSSLVKGFVSGRR
jgi:hypothetical protein